MIFHSKLFLIESGELRKAVDEYREAFVAAHKRINDYIVSLGGDGYRTNMDDELCEIKFPHGKAPEGFKMQNREGITSPKKRSTFYEKFQKYTLPKSEEWIQKYINCPTKLEYSTSAGNEYVRIGHPFKPVGLYWFSMKKPVLLRVPDVNFYAKEITEDEDVNELDVIFKDDCDKWELSFDGVREIFEEEWKYLEAKHKRETKSAA